MTKEQMIVRGYKERTLQDWDKCIVDAGVALNDRQGTLASIGHRWQWRKILREVLSDA